MFWSIRAASLALEEASRRGGPALPTLPYFGLTMLVELVVAGAYGLLRWKADASERIVRLALIALINLLTYPVVWGLFPVLLRFAPPGGRLLGWGIAAFMQVLSGPFWLMFNAGSHRGRIVSTVGIVLSLLVGAGCLVIFAFAVLYPDGHPPAGGLPVWLALQSAEAYAVLVESLLLFGFTRRRVDFQEARLVSLMMNMASFVIGLLFAL